MVAFSNHSGVIEVSQNRGCSERKSGGYEIFRRKTKELSDLMYDDTGICSRADWSESAGSFQVENGTSDPSTSNLFALAKLFGISVEELLRDVG